MSEIGRLDVSRFAVGWRRALARRRLSAMVNGRGATYALGVLVGLVVLSPWPFGSVLPRTTQAIVLATLGSALLALALSLLGRSSSPLHAVDGRLAMALLFVLGLWALGALQLVPLPRSLHALLAPGSASVWHPTEAAAAAVLGPGPHPISVYPTATARWLAFFAGIASLALVAAPALRERRTLLRTSVTVVSMAVAIALYAFVARLWFGDRVFGVYQSVIPPFGPFVSKNHFAGYVEMAALLAVGLAAGLAAENRTGPGLFDWIEGPRAGRVVGAWSAATILVLAVPVSLSRGGVVSLAAGLVAFAFLRVASRYTAGGREPSRRGKTAAAATLAGGMIMAAVIFFVLPEPARARIASIGGSDPSSSYRLGLWHDTLRLATSSPIVGWGFGAYADAIPRFKTAAGAVRVAHAESDWLELLAEGGLVGGGLAACAIAFVGAFAWRNVRADVHRLSRAVRTGALGGLVALCVHSFFDFNLHIPSNALLAVLSLAIIVGPCSLSATRRLGRLGGAVLVLSFVLAIATPWSAPRGLAERLSIESGLLRRASAERDLASRLRRRPAAVEAWLELAWLRSSATPAEGAALADVGADLDPTNEQVRHAADDLKRR